MKILTKDQYVDFEAPIQMIDEQRKQFVSFMKSEFEDLETEEVKEKTKEIGKREITSKHWSTRELSLLLSPEGNNKLATKTNRSVMSIKMMRGHFVPEFMVWARKKGNSLPVKLEIIEEFLKEGDKK